MVGRRCRTAPHLAKGRTNPVKFAKTKHGNLKKKVYWLVGLNPRTKILVIRDHLQLGLKNTYLTPPRCLETNGATTLQPWRIFFADANHDGFQPKIWNGRSLCVGIILIQHFDHFIKLRLPHSIYSIYWFSIIFLMKLGSFWGATGMGISDVLCAGCVGCAFVHRAFNGYLSQGGSHTEQEGSCKDVWTENERTTMHLGDLQPHNQVQVFPEHFSTTMGIP